MTWDFFFNVPDSFFIYFFLFSGFFSLIFIYCMCLDQKTTFGSQSFCHMGSKPQTRVSHQDWWQGSFLTRNAISKPLCFFFFFLRQNLMYPKLDLNCDTAKDDLELILLSPPPKS